MNAALRKVALAALALFGLLLVNLNYVQVVAANRLKNDPANSRVLVEEYASQRGQIVAGGEAVATSVETDDRLKYLRRYPAGPLYAHLTGYHSLVYGDSGLEAEHDELLSGDDNRFFVRRLSDIVTGRTSRGGVVELTVDRELQDLAARLLGDKPGAIVALEPATGAVLAMASNPSYDPNPLSSHDPAGIRAAFERLAKDRGRPLVNRATQRAYPPGSTFKVVTAAAAIEHLGMTPDTVIDSPSEFPLPDTRIAIRNFGRNNPCGGDRLPLKESFQRSCNADFAKLGSGVGAAALQEQAERFGFNARPDLGLPVAASVFPEGINRPQTAQSAIGQFDVRATPLQMAMVAAGVANRGTVMTPYLVSRLLGPELDVVSTTRPRVFGDGPAVRPETAAMLTSMMELVVASGTGRKAGVPGVRVAGKTGTAQNAENAPPHAWFLGFAPADSPRIAVAVLLEASDRTSEEATGGGLAAPLAAQLFAAALR